MKQKTEYSEAWRDQKAAEIVTELADQKAAEMLTPGEICPGCRTCHSGPKCPPNPYWENNDAK
jgi:hypothetical protein